MDTRIAKWRGDAPVEFTCDTAAAGLLNPSLASSKTGSQNATGQAVAGG